MAGGAATFRLWSTGRRTECKSPVAPSIRAEPPVAAGVPGLQEKEPDARPQRADEMVQALVGVFTPGAVAGSVPQSAGGHAAPRQAGGRRNPLSAGGALVLVAVVLWLASRGRSVLTGAPTGVAAVDTNRSIAVLPLANLSGDKADDYFGIGLAEEMTGALTQSGVRVIGRTSAGALLARGMDERTIARELGVGTLLSGSVQRAAGQIRINVSLLSASDGAVRWTERYDRPIANVFAVQDEIARAVATQLNGAGAPRVVSAAGRAATTDPETYALYLQGLVLSATWTDAIRRKATSLSSRRSRGRRQGRHRMPPVLRCGNDRLRSTDDLKPSCVA